MRILSSKQIVTLPAQNLNSHSGNSDRKILNASRRKTLLYALKNNYIFCLTRPTAQNTRNTSRSTTTTLAPDGVSNAYDSTIPSRKHTTDTTAAHTVTDRNVRHTRMAVSAGKMTRLEMSSAPIMRMPSTMVSAVSRAMSILYASVLTPVALENVSSNVTAKMRG